MLPLSGWSYCKPITVQHAYLDADEVNFTFMVFRTGDTDIGAHALANGFDIRFTLADGVTLLGYERRSFAIAGGAATGVWAVLIPSVHTAGGDIIYIHYGKAGASDGSDAPNAYDTGFKCVWPLDEAYSTGAGNYKDRKSGHDLTLTDADADSGQANGPINKAVDLNGDADFLLGTAHSDFDFGGAATIEVWINLPTLVFSNKATIGRDAQGSYRWHFHLGEKHGGGDKHVDFLLNTGGPVWTGQADTELSAGSWFYIVGTFDRTLPSNRQKLYVQGALGAQTNANDSDVVSGGPDFEIGKIWADYIACRFAECRFSISTRSAAWIKFTYRNITEADHEQTWGAEEAAPVTYTLAGTISGASSFTGDAKMTARLAGSIQAASTLTGETKATMRLAGAIAGASGLSGGMKAIMKLAGTMAAHSTLTGNLFEIFSRLKAIIFTAPSRERIAVVPDRRRIRVVPDRGRIVIVDERK